MATNGTSPATTNAAQQGGAVSTGLGKTLEQMLVAQEIGGRSLAPERHSRCSKPSLCSGELVHPLRCGRRCIAGLFGVIDKK